MEAEEKQAIQAYMAVESQAKSGADWFFWIAALSIINSVIVLSGSNWSFVVGLGVTQIIDAIGGAFADDLGNVAKIVALVLDVMAAGLFALFGVFARKKHAWSFIAGMSLYALDGLLFLLVKDFLSMAFHAYALYCIYKGFTSAKTLKTLDLQAVEDNSVASEIVRPL